MKHVIDVESDWNYLTSKLPPQWRELASANGVRLDPDDRHAKIKDLGVVLRLILHLVCTGSSLKTTTALAAALGIVDISGTALHKWMRKSGGWLAAMVSTSLDTSSSFAAALWAGYEVIAADATSVQRPGALGTTARVHFALRLADLRAVFIKVTDVDVGETLCNFVMHAGQLWLADRGYSNANSIAHAVTCGADVLIRHCFGPLPLFDLHGKPIDVVARVSKVNRAGRVKQWTACVHPSHGTRIVGRLIATRLPAAQAEKARKRVIDDHRRKRRREVSAEVLELAGYVVLFTTVPKLRLTALQLSELYRLRWQVELSFKRDKSIGGLDNLPNFRPDTIHSWICAMMLGREIARRLAEPREPFPPLSSEPSPSASADSATSTTTAPPVREPWRCAVMLWHAFRSVVMRVPVGDVLIDTVARFVEHLGRCNESAREKRVTRFLRLSGVKSG